MTGSAVTDVAIIILAYIAGIGVGCTIIEYRYLQAAKDKTRKGLDYDD